MVLSSTADDQHISHRLPDPTRSFPSPLSPRMVLSLSHFALSGPSPSPRIACAALLPVQVYRLLYEPSFLFSFSCSRLLPLFSRPPSLLRHPGPSTSARLPSPAPPTLASPSHPSALPTFLVLSPSFLALNSPSCPTLTLLAGLFSRPLHPHPSHFPHVRHPPVSPTLASPPCPVLLAPLVSSRPPLRPHPRRPHLVRLDPRELSSPSDTCLYPLTLLSPNSHPPFPPSSRPPRPPHALHTCIALLPMQTSRRWCMRIVRASCK